MKERIPGVPAEQQGLFRKYEVVRVDGQDLPGGKHHNCRLFVLDYDHDPHARVAMIAYANSVAQSHPQLAQDLHDEWGIL